MITGTRLKVIFVTAEMAPFAKVGGLADVAGALPRALADIGCDVTVYMPMYGSIDLARHGIRGAHQNEAGRVEINGTELEFQMFTLQNSGHKNLKVQFIASTEFFDRNGVYSDNATGEPFEDNDLRYIFFQKAVIRRLEMMETKPDVIHCNDHHTGLIPWFIKNHHLSDVRTISTVLSIHNLAYQGQTDPAMMAAAGIPKDLFYPMSPFEFYGGFNMLKAGLIFSDQLTTVSPSYAEEIQSLESLGAGLQGVLKDRSADLVGILNGVDYVIWDPANDDTIPTPYSADNLAGKQTAKRELLQHFNLPGTKKRLPLIGMISRLVEQKGLDILIPALRQVLAEEKAQCVILGTGTRKYHQALEELASEYPDSMAVEFAYNDKLSHLIEAGCDIYLMPSRYEPCGLNQMFSQRYGTVPVVHATGGLKDSVIDADEQPRKATGFTFNDYSSVSLIAALQRAFDRYKNKKRWETLVKRAMQSDFSWTKAAQQYVSVYKQALHKEN